MLYFSESGWTLPDLTSVYEEFDRQYEQDEYEQKIAGLIRKADQHARKESRDEYEAWWAAVRFLKSEDHYMSGMIGIAGIRPAGDQWRLLGAGLGIVTCVLLAEFLSLKYRLDLSLDSPARGVLIFYTVECAVCVVVACLFFRFIVGKKKADEITSKALEEALHIYQPTK